MELTGINTFEKLVVGQRQLKDQLFARDCGVQEWRLPIIGPYVALSELRGHWSGYHCSRFHLISQCNVRHILLRLGTVNKV